MIMNEIKTGQLKKWMSGFGKSYTDRNNLSLEEFEDLNTKKFGLSRSSLNNEFLQDIDRSVRILEIGSNIGNQLLCLERIGFQNLYGIEPQDYALKIAKGRSKKIQFIEATIFSLPFRDNYFDLVFTSGVLIHISPKDIKSAMQEIYRCARKYIWGFEYFAEKYQGVDYRGQTNLLWKANFPKLYLDLFPDLKPIRERRLQCGYNNDIDIMFLLSKK